MEKHRHQLVATQESMAAVFVIVWCPVVVKGITIARVVCRNKRHVTFPALNRFYRIVRHIPVTFTPVIILILELHPADAIHLLVDELLVA
jgi:hypothetical protein